MLNTGFRLKAAGLSANLLTPPQTPVQTIQLYIPFKQGPRVMDTCYISSIIWQQQNSMHKRTGKTKPDIIVTVSRPVVVAVGRAQVHRIIVPGATADNR
jgi:hypothetical protein